MVVLVLLVSAVEWWVRAATSVFKQNLVYWDYMLQKVMVLLTALAQVWVEPVAQWRAYLAMSLRVHLSYGIIDE